MHHNNLCRCQATLTKEIFFLLRIACYRSKEKCLIFPCPEDQDRWVQMHFVSITQNQSLFWVFAMDQRSLAKNENCFLWGFFRTHTLYIRVYESVYSVYLRISKSFNKYRPSVCTFPKFSKFTRCKTNCHNFFFPDKQSLFKFLSLFGGSFLYFPKMIRNFPHIEFAVQRLVMNQEFTVHFFQTNLKIRALNEHITAKFT